MQHLCISSREEKDYTNNTFPTYNEVVASLEESKSNFKGKEFLRLTIWKGELRCDNDRTQSNRFDAGL